MSSGAFDTILADLKKQVETIGDVDIKHASPSSLNSWSSKCWAIKIPLSSL